MIKIYANEKPILLTNILTEELVEQSKKLDTLVINQPKIEVENILSQLQNDKINRCIIVGKNFTSLKKDFFSQFENIEAAGGIVQNERKEILFIFRRQKWDLPKGKLEDGESKETCAEREIEEETGIKNLILKRKVGTTYHIYVEQQIKILKSSHWFFYTTISSLQKLTPQMEEDIAEVKWIATEKIKLPMGNTYANIREIMSIFFDTP